MKKLRVLMAVHPSFRPDRKPIRSASEKDVWDAIKHLGHETQVMAVQNNLANVIKVIDGFQPDIVFNLLEEFRGEAVFDFHLVSYLEAHGIAFTGCNPRGLILSRNKLIAGQVALGVGVPVPWTQMSGSTNGGLKFPLFVKLNREHASLGIRESNRVTTPHQLRKTVGRLKRDFASEVIVQEFIAGQDVAVSIWGNGRIRVLPPRRLHTRGGAGVSTRRLKFSPSFQRQRLPQSHEFTNAIVPKLCAQSRRLYSALDLSGYARFDFRVNQTNQAYLIDVNANPNLAQDEDFARSALGEGIDYPEVIDEILRLGMAYRPRS